MENEINVSLDTPIEYHSKGEVATASFIKLLPPTSRHAADCGFLKQAFMRALPKDDGKENTERKEKEEKVTGPEVMTLMYMSEKVDIAGVFGHARALFTSGVALVDGEEKLTKPLLDDVSQEDFEKMIGDYLVNFILASALQKRKKS